MKEIAIYGKGGIGKSTVAANLSAALTKFNYKVLQIGCDPKHDSTRLLLNQKSITTVLDYIKVTNPLYYDVNDILFSGYNNIGCVEAGGPEPGVGCAGRGIITTFELLDQFKIKENYDITIYDVLGDVVCGGFAVPIRQEYANMIFIVTSGEYMSLYAANNILRGIKNYDNDQSRVAGIIYNKRDINGEDERLEKFSKAVELPICAIVERNNVFAFADQNNKTVVENGLEKEVDFVFSRLAKKIKENLLLYPAKPVSDEELERLIFNKQLLKEQESHQKNSKVIRENKLQQQIEDRVDLSNTNRYLSKNVIYVEPLHGCAFNGALSTAIHLLDVRIIAHSPKSCAFLSYQSISSLGRRSLFERGSLLPASIAPNFETSEMDESDIIFGGIERLEQTVKRAISDKPKAIIIISSCPSGIIGDDIDKVKRLATEQTRIHTIKTDGNLTGDYLQGMLMAYTKIANYFIKKDVIVKDKSVNIVFEKTVPNNTNSNFLKIKSYLDQLGISINCRFLYETKLEELENFLAAPLNLLAFNDYTGQILKDFFVNEYNASFLKSDFPIGFNQTCQWLKEVAEYFGVEDKIENIINHARLEYDNEISDLKRALKGKKLMVITYNHELDWILKTALDLEMVVVKIGILNFSQDDGFRTELNHSFNVEVKYDTNNKDNDIKQLEPDILLTNYANTDNYHVKVADTIPMCPNVGFDSGIILAQRWAKLLQLNLQGEWVNDERLFNKHYSR